MFSYYFKATSNDSHPENNITEQDIIDQLTKNGFIICRGGCASRAFAEHGSYFREHCGEAKEIFAFVASRVAGEAWAKNHESELSLSLAGPLSRLTEAERKTLTESRSQKEIFTCLKAAKAEMRKILGQIY